MNKNILPVLAAVLLIVGGLTLSLSQSNNIVANQEMSSTPGISNMDQVSKDIIPPNKSIQKPQKPKVPNPGNIPTPDSSSCNGGSCGGQASSGDSDSNTYYRTGPIRRLFGR